MKKRLLLLFAMLAVIFTTVMADNVVSANPLTIAKSGTADLTINLKNSDEVRGVQFKLTLPANVIIQGSDAGITYTDQSSQTYTPTNGVKVSLTDRTTGWTVVGNKVSGENSYIFVLISLSGNSLASSEDASPIMKIAFVAENATEGNYNVDITDIHLSINGSSADIAQANTSTTLTISNVLKGDVNGNEEVDIDDAVCILRYLVHKDNNIFIEAAADVNGNGEIDIDDAVMILKYLVHKIPSFTRSSSADEDWDVHDPD